MEGARSDQNKGEACTDSQQKRVGKDEWPKRLQKFLFRIIV